MKLLLPFLLLIFSLFPLVSEAQTLPEPRQSPIGLTRMMMDDTYVKVVYGRPHVRDREIFGALVPFGEVWRTGANEATEITTTRDIILGDQLLKAGTYSLFTIPGKDQWTVIVSHQLGLWGSYTYSPERDAFRINMPVETPASKVNLFTMVLESKDDITGTLTMEWEHSRIVVPIRKP
jgi:hypothetical protein